MVGIIDAIFTIIQLVLQLYVYVLIAMAIYSWLYAFNVVNSRNPLVNSIGGFLYNVTEPVLRPIRRFMPDLGGVDLSPLVVLLIIFFIKMILANPIEPAVLSLFL